MYVWDYVHFNFTTSTADAHVIRPTKSILFPAILLFTESSVVFVVVSIS